MKRSQQSDASSAITYPIVFYGTRQDTDAAVQRLRETLSHVSELPPKHVQTVRRRSKGLWLPLGQGAQSENDAEHRVVHVPVTVHLRTVRRLVDETPTSERVLADRTDVIAYPDNCGQHSPSGVPYLLSELSNVPDMWAVKPFADYVPHGAKQPDSAQPVTIAILDSFPQLDWLAQDLTKLNLIGYGDYVRAEHNHPDWFLQDSPDWTPHIETELPQVYGTAVKVKQVRDLKTLTTLHRYHGLIVAAICQRLVPNVRFVFMRILSENGHGYSTDLIHALDDLRRVRDQIQGPLLVNVSLGLEHTDQGGVDNRGLQQAIRKLVSSSSELTQLICATGNESEPAKRLNPQEPAAYGYMDDNTDIFAHVIPSAAADSLSVLRGKPHLAYFSNRAPLSVPATHMIMRTAPEGVTPEDDVPDYVLWAGTSFATPVITSMVARALNQGTVQPVTPPPLVPNNLMGEAVKSDLWTRAHKGETVAVVQPI